MSQSTDPWDAPLPPPERVFYATGVLLDPTDFRAEQLFHRGRLARALAYLHGWGTAAGLKVEWEAPLAPGAVAQFPDGRTERLVVRPGLAIDRLGRLIEVPRDACLPLNEWFEAQGDKVPPFTLHAGAVVADVFIRFTVCEHGKTPALASGPFDALDAVKPARLRDWYHLDLVPRSEDEPAAPHSPWPDLRGAANDDERRTRLHAEVLKAWREGVQWDQHGKLKPLAEHVKDMDPTALFLARVRIPAQESGGDNPRIVRTAGADVTVDNDRRAFVYPVAALAAAAGLPGV